MVTVSILIIASATFWAVRFWPRVGVDQYGCYQGVKWSLFAASEHQGEGDESERSDHPRRYGPLFPA